MSEDEVRETPEGGFAIKSARAPDEITSEHLDESRYADDG
jgi:hypothetical protein